MPLTF